MLFNSIDFAIFLPLVFLLYWFVFNKSLKLQNILILVSSYIFYGWWDWRFLILIFTSSLIDFVIGLKLKKEENINRRKLYLLISIFANLGLLGFFKYYNFFVDSFTMAFSFFGYQINDYNLNIILPVGISFYTFQTMSYIFDIYKRKLEPTNNIINFLAFVSFFPQLVAGPIERAINLLPQFNKKREFDFIYASDGLRQILWGFVKKILIAENCGTYINPIFADYQDHTGSTILFASIIFGFQIYCDFSGYSDIAIGTAKLFGFDLMQNFAYPFFSRNISEFWRRWHISLTTWFRDYIYFPLGGSRGNKLSIIRNTFIVFLVSGFWHGPAWTYVIYGALNGAYFLPIILKKTKTDYIGIIAQDTFFPNLKEFSLMLFNIYAIGYLWMMFRAENLNHALSMYKTVFSLSLFYKIDTFNPKVLIILSFFLGLEWIGRKYDCPLHILNNVNIFYRWIIYVLLILSVFYFGNFNENEFIYFQF